MLQLAHRPPAAEAVTSNPKVGQATSNVGWFEQSKYGLFVHYVPGYTVKADGTKLTGSPTTDPRHVKVYADAFNVNQFAADVDSFGIDYLVFTATHSQTLPLWPSPTQEAVRPNTSSTRDLIAELIAALKPYGIRLVLYVNVTDGHQFSSADKLATGWDDPTNGYKKWNDYVNGIIGELGTRYGDDVEGFWMDMVFHGDFQNKIDKARLRATMLIGNPNRVLLGNVGYHYTDDAVLGRGTIDYPAYEYSGQSDVKGWPTTPNQMAGVVPTSFWYAESPEGTNVMPSTAEDMFRYLVLQAGVNERGGGTAYSMGNYAGLTGSLWETGVKPAMQTLGTYVQAAGDTLRNTRQSAAFPTKAGTTLNGMPTPGWVALSSQDETKTYLHVLNPPASGNTLTLPVPANGVGVASAVNTATGHPVTVTTSGSGVTLTLTGGDTWQTTGTKDTVLTLTNAVPSYTSLRNDDQPLTLTGTWATSSNRGAGDYNDDVKYTTANGASFEYTFTGSGVTYVAPRAPQYGDADIYIDGRLYGRYSAYAPTYTAQQTIFKTTALASGNHTLKVVKVNGQWMQVDGLDAAPINDTATAITYTGTWGHSKSRGGGDFGDDVHYATANGASFEATFTGSSIDYITSKAPQYGSFDVYVDGVLQSGTYSAYAATYTPRQVVFSKTGLSAGAHTLKAVKTGGSWLQVDALKIR